jgi:hypothetical protein
MEILQEKEIFMQEVIKMEEGTNECNHVFMRVASDETEMQFKCLRGCGCDNTTITYPESYLFALQLLNNSKILSELIVKNDTISSEEYYNKVRTYVEKRLGKRIELEEDYEIVMKFVLEFEKICFDSLLNEYYSMLFRFDKHLINNPNLSEKETMGLFHTLSEENVLSSEAIVENINSATPNGSATLVHSKDEK